MRTNALVILQGLFGCLPWGMILTYLNDFLSQNKGLSEQTATLVGGWVSGGHYREERCVCVWGGYVEHEVAVEMAGRWVVRGEAGSGDGCGCSPPPLLILLSPRSPHPHATCDPPQVLLVLGLGGAVGVVGGGALGQALYNRRKWSMSVFIGGCTVLGVLPLYYIVNADVKASPALTVVMALLAGGLSGTVGPNMR